MTESKTLIIWGMHRSGTSLLGSWLHACGLDVGNELLGEGIGNERGHYEDMDFLRLHERILNANGIKCGGLLRTEPLQLTVQMQQEMGELVRRKCQSPQWGWKEPRTCLFTREYIGLLPHAYHLVVYRHYALVVDSLVRRHIKKRIRRMQSKNGLKRRYYQLQLDLWQHFRLSQVVNQHLAAWIKYNENLLSLIEQVGMDKVMVMDCREFVAASVPIFACLQEWGFVLQSQPAENYVDPAMIASKPSRKFALDATLQARAESVNLQLKKISTGIAR